MLELYRAIIPAKFIINDNHGTHYKVHMSCINFLERQFQRIINNEEDAPGEFKIPSLEAVAEYLNTKILINEDSNSKIIDPNEYPVISLRCEVWRPVNNRFDPQNYAKTFKAPIDLLDESGYLIDDCWKFVNGITYVGGGESVWKDRAIRYENDGLPNELTVEWWNKYSDYTGDIMIRILIDKN